MKSTKVLVLTAMVAVATASSAGAQLFISCGGAGEARHRSVIDDLPFDKHRFGDGSDRCAFDVTSLTTTLTAPLGGGFPVRPRVLPAPARASTSKANARLPRSRPRRLRRRWTGPATSTKPASDLKMNVNAGTQRRRLARLERRPPRQPPRTTRSATTSIYNLDHGYPGRLFARRELHLTAP